MKVENMTSGSGNKVANQFIITDEGRGANGNFTVRRVFQSYSSIIAIVTRWPGETRVELDENKWDYSKTTGKYRNQFLGESKKETERKIKDGTYKLADLNRA
jgi:hypothetical protein